MKKAWLITLFVLPTAFCQAQKTSLHIGSGYAFSATSQTLLLNNYNSNSFSRTEIVKASLGRGTGIVAGVRHWIRPWIGIALDADYRKTLPAIKGSSRSTGIDYSYNSENKWKSQAVFVSPSILFKVVGRKLNPYAAVGILVPVYSRVNMKSAYTSSGFGGTTSGGSEQKMTLKNTVGFNSSLGIAPAINKRFSFFASLNLQAISIQAKKSTMLSIKANGVEMIDAYTTNDREILYVKKLKDNTYDENKPRKEIGFSLPYSSIGVSAGLQINL